MTRLAGTCSRNEASFPVDRQEAHAKGIVHRAVHVEISDGEGRFLVWRRRDGRLEIPGGHVDWLDERGRAESYDEAALRELNEELGLEANWGLAAPAVLDRLRGALAPLLMTTNQLPARHGHNNEFVAVYRLTWRSTLGDPCNAAWLLGADEGATTPSWRSAGELERSCCDDPKLPTSALRLFLQRRGWLTAFTP